MKGLSSKLFRVSSSSLRLKEACHRVSRKAKANKTQAERAPAFKTPRPRVLTGIKGGRPTALSRRLVQGRLSGECKISSLSKRKRSL